MKKMSPLVYVSGFLFVAVIADLVTDIGEYLLLRFGFCKIGDGECLSEKKIIIILIILGMGTVLTVYNHTLANESFRRKFWEFIKIPSPKNIRLYPELTNKNEIILKLQIRQKYL